MEWSLKMVWFGLGGIYCFYEKNWKWVLNHKKPYAIETEVETTFVPDVVVRRLVKIGNIKFKNFDTRHIIFNVSILNGFVEIKMD